jgi:hypothetical protein
MPPRRMIARTARLAGRALVGAFAGLVIVTLATVLATEYFGVFRFENSDWGDRAFLRFIGWGVLAFAGLASAFGGKTITGRCEATAKGMLAGTAVGVLLGFLGPALGSKAAAFLGIFLGGPIGAILGGVVAFVGYGIPGKKPHSTDDLA